LLEETGVVAVSPQLSTCGFAQGASMIQSVHSPVRGVDRLADAVTRWSRLSGNATAVSAADGDLTFTELSEQIAALAGKLAAHGVSRRTPVGLLLGRSRLGLAGLLAVFSLGATAVLLDERHPSERIGFALRDTGTRVVLGERADAGLLPSDVKLIDPNTAGVHPAEPVTPEAEDCAYIVYTSGTTGWPKGVEVTYGNLGTFLDAVTAIGLEPGGLGINAVSPAFDGWLWCTLVYLVHGQGIALVDFNAASGSGDLAALVADRKPATVCLTPTLLAALGEIPTTEVIMVAGEACPPALLARLADTPRVLNVYGPTEATIACTWADTARGDDPSTIGRPIPGYRIHVLDEHGEPVADGVEGELHVAGPAVSRGYRNQPELTAERFVPDTFAGEGRMYRTGDMVVMRPDGQLEYRGRADAQVKVRGFRVELRELEQVVAEVDGVASVAAFTVSTGDSLGVAVTVLDGMDAADCVTRIRVHCATRLPDYLRPTAVGVVDALPALPTGKVDREALKNTVQPEVEGSAPTTEREQQVCAVWSDVLDRPINDVSANFFEVGGHSLLAARTVGVLRRSTGLPLSVGHLLADPTPAGLARELDALAGNPS
jgi:amino acid adenylation domain-containing protein